MKENATLAVIEARKSRTNNDAELKRAEYLTDELHRAVSNAKKFGIHHRVSVPIAIAEELLQLLADSIKGIKQHTGK